MRRNKLIQEIITERWAVRYEFARGYEHAIHTMTKTGNLPGIEMEKEAIAFRTNTSLTYDEKVGYAEAEEDSVAIIDIIGPMTRYGGWCSYGTEDYADLISMAMNASNISAILLNIDTPGGSTSSLFPMEELMRKTNKPIVAYVNAMAYSAGYYLASLCSSIIANNKMAEVGSIGVMAALTDTRKADEKRGYKIIYLHPEESNFKNRAVRSALDGDYDELVDTMLRPWAIHFQNVVKEGRSGKLDVSIEGLLNGREFYAYDAVKNGLVDDIMDIESAILYTANLAVANNKNKQILSML